MHPVNLALRFFLEIAALGGFATLAWKSFDGWARILVLMVVLGTLMTVWGVFAVPNDLSRSGAAPVPVSGITRLVIELAILMGGAFAYYLMGFGLAAISLTFLIILHYGLSGERIAWLLQQ